MLFLDFMLFYLKELEENPEDICTIFDNCPIHKARLLREYRTKKGAKLYFLSYLRTYLQLRSIF